MLVVSDGGPIIDVVFWCFSRKLDVWLVFGKTVRSVCLFIFVCRELGEEREHGRPACIPKFHHDDENPRNPTYALFSGPSFFGQEGGSGKHKWYKFICLLLSCRFVRPPTKN